MSLQSASGEFWKQKWIEGESSWHKDAVQETLKTHVSFLQDTDGVYVPRVFVPLCGKSIDMLWLVQQGFAVAGCEISELAVEQFFTDNSIPYTKSSSDKFTIYKATDCKIELYLGNIYDCTIDSVGQFDSIWDCSAMVAVNPEDRQKYVNTLTALLKPKGHILLTTYEYDQSLRFEFPLSVTEAIVSTLYKGECLVTFIAKIDMEGTYFLSKFNLPWANRLVFYIDKRN